MAHEFGRADKDHSVDQHAFSSLWSLGRFAAQAPPAIFNE
jgi:hypothetical protein